jgi:hypothetical protein
VCVYLAPSTTTTSKAFTEVYECLQHRNESGRDLCHPSRGPPGNHSESSRSHSLTPGDHIQSTRSDFEPVGGEDTNESREGTRGPR